MLLTVLLWTLGLLLGLALLLLLLPFHAEAHGAASAERLEGYAGLSWGWRVLMFRADSARGLEVRILGVRVWSGSKGKKAEEEPLPKEPTVKKKRRRWAGLATWRERALAGRRMLETTLATIRVRGYVYGVLGTGDPATTGMLFAVLDQVAQRSRRIELAVTPDWMDADADLEAGLTIRVWPAHTLLALVWLLIRDAPARRGAWTMVRPT